MTNEKLVEKFRIIANSNYNKDIHGKSGLCGLLAISWATPTFLNLDRNQYILINELMKKWSIKHGSKHPVFPVPSFNKRLMCNYKFSCTTPEQKWSKRTKYGRARRHMCNFIANDIEAETKRN